MNKKSIQYVANEIAKNRLGNEYSVKCDMLFKLLFDNINEESSIFFSKLKEFFNCKGYMLEVDKMIEFIKDKVSPDKACLMKTIIDYQNAKRFNFQNAEKQFERKIYDLSQLSSIKKIIESKNYNNSVMNPKKRTNDSIERLKSNVKILLSSDETFEELVKDGKISDKHLFENIRARAKEFSKEELTSIYILKYHLKQISEKEINQYVEVLEYFIKNLEINIENSKKESNLNQLKTLRVKLTMYRTISDYLKKFIQNLKIENFEQLSHYDKKYILNDEEFIIDYYNDILNVLMTYMKICKLNTISDNKLKELKEEFQKQLIIQN